VDDRPLRHEEYLAMSEECRRLKNENVKLKNLPERRKRNMMILKNIAVNGMRVSVVVLCLLGMLGIFHSLLSSTPPEPCYWSAVANPDFPWEPYHIRKSGSSDDCVECRTNCSSAHCPGFKTYEDAETFIKKWKFRRCPSR
jgi:hypothetical protein